MLTSVLGALAVELLAHLCQHVLMPKVAIQGSRCLKKKKQGKGKIHRRSHKERKTWIIVLSMGLFLYDHLHMAIYNSTANDLKVDSTAYRSQPADTPTTGRACPHPEPCAKKRTAPTLKKNPHVCVDHRTCGPSTSTSRATSVTNLLLCSRTSYGQQ